MREFVDATGERWDVILGRESWGAFYLLFVPGGERRSDVPVRRAIVEEESQVEASRMLMGATEEELQAFFQRSEPREDPEVERD